MTEPVSEQRALREPIPAGRYALGAILILIGVGTLIESAGWGEVPWELLLPVALIIIGVAMLFAAQGGRTRGLFVWGVILCVLLAGSTTFNVTASGGIGDRVVVVSSSEQLAPSYELGMGSLVLDLSGLTLESGITEVAVHVGVGDLSVILPPSAEVFVEAHASVGEVALPDGGADGVGARRSYRSAGYDTAVTALRLELSVGLGSVEVRL